MFLINHLVNYSPKNFISLKAFNLVFSFIEVWFTHQNSKPLAIEDKINITLVGYRFLSFAKKTGKYINKNVSGKYSQTPLDHAKQSATDAFKTSSKRVIEKIAEATSDLISNKIVKKIMVVSKNLQQNNSVIVTNENDKEIPKGRYISQERRQ